MKWPWQRKNAERREVGELLDFYHPRASVSTGEQMVFAPGKVLENVALAMERIDLDIDTTISIEEDVAPVGELLGLMQFPKGGPLLVAHVVNTALRIMASRYPAELVRREFLPDYDLRKIVPVTLDDHQHEVARTIFNLRTVSTVDLTDDDVAAHTESLDVPGQMAVFVAVFFMYGTKVGALKHRTGIE